ncbi:MAG TPA: hypothetical protein VGE53_02525 [Candidatus Paceibacterota bacterium]
MGFLRPGIPLEDKKREYRRNAEVGVIIKASHDAAEAEKKEGVTKLPRVGKKEVWNKKARRYRYREGVIEKGKKSGKMEKVGGRFAPTPDWAPADRQPKKKRASSRK